MKGIVKFFLKTGVGQMILAEVLELFKAWILKVFAEKHNHENELPIVRKLETGLMELDVNDFIRRKQDAEFHFLASRLSKGEAIAQHFINRAPTLWDNQTSKNA